MYLPTMGQRWAVKKLVLWQFWFAQVLCLSQANISKRFQGDYRTAPSGPVPVDRRLDGYNCVPPYPHAVAFARLRRANATAWRG